MPDLLLVLSLISQGALGGGEADFVSLALGRKGHAFVAVEAPCLTPPALDSEIARLAAAHPGKITTETVGTTFLGRGIKMVSLGQGSKSILFWSQMHGDEPTATPALLDLADFLAGESARPEVSRIFNTFTLRMIPMLNPDGAAAYQRRNGQGIDINRDALMRTTPEGRILKAVRDRFSPILGFNLHDQGRRVTVGNTGVLSSISLLAVAGDAEGTMTPGRLRAKRVASRIVKTLTPLIPGGIARYDEDWSPRAFGDNLTAWGSPVVLIESGGFPKGGGFRDLTHLNFVALASALDGLARNDLSDETPDAYDLLLRNRPDAFADIVITGASLLDPGSGQWFEADLALDILVPDRTWAGCPAPPRSGSRVVEVGDTRELTSGLRIDGQGLLVAPLDLDHGLPPGEISIEGLLASRTAEVPPSDNPRVVLGRLRRSATGVARNGPANFVIWSRGRYFVVADGAGLDRLK